MRKEFCEKDGIYISYTNDDVCFEDITTAESILLKIMAKLSIVILMKKKINFFKIILNKFILQL